ncbi:MAG: ABC transporter permease [Acidipila sp.]|nr:ABC transporter permease [Acidipila sp.]
METLWQDLRYAARSLRKNAGFTAVAVLTLALGIGANTAIFSFVYGILLRPLPYAHPERLVVLEDYQANYGKAPSSYPEYVDWKDQKQIFEQVDTFFMSSAALTGTRQPEQVRVVQASAGLAALLGAQPFLGRSFLGDEDKPSAPRVVMLEYGFWQKQFGGDRNIIGQTLQIEANPYTVIGILPASFHFERPADVWMGLRLDESISERGLHYLTVMGRLRPGLSLAAARQEAASVEKRLQEQRKTTHGLRLTDAQTFRVGDARPSLLALLGAVGFLLLIACANVANLLLARASARQREMAVRRALGASRGRLIRQLLTESLLLSALGGALGALLAWWGVDLMTAAAAHSIARIEEVRLGGGVLLFTLFVSVATGVLFGLAPALRATQSSLGASLKAGGRSGSEGAHSRGLRSLLVVSEVALSLVLLVGAGLMIHSFTRLMRVPRGFDSSGVLSFQVSLPKARYEKAEQQRQFFQATLERLRALPGVTSVGLTSALPASGDGANGGVGVEGLAADPENLPMAEKTITGGNYFSAMRIPLRRGRYFSEKDTATSPQTAIVNEAFARRFFPNQDPIGKRLDFMWETKGMQEIVGVVADVNYHGMESQITPQIYVPYVQRPDPYATIVVRSSGDLAALPAAAREAVLAVDASQPISDVRTADAVVARSLAPRNLSVTLFALFGGLGLALVAVGIFGVISYSVSQRTREIGVRVAFGAQQRDIVNLVVGQGLRLVVAGVGVGLLASFVLTRLMAGLLYSVTPTDPVTFGGVTVLLGAIALAACYVPARRAMRVDAMVALRYE